MIISSVKIFKRYYVLHFFIQLNIIKYNNRVIFVFCSLHFFHLFLAIMAYFRRNGNGILRSVSDTAKKQEVQNLFFALEKFFML